jgi:phage tail-like protein
MATASSTLGTRTDPLIAHNFLVRLVDSSSSLALGSTAASVTAAAAAGFSECTGLEMSLDVEEYREGGRNSEVLQFPTRIRWSKIALKKGVTQDTSLWDWHFQFVEGKGKRRDGIIVLLDDVRTPAHIWYFRRGLPVKYSGAALSALQSSVAIESLEIAHEGLYQLPAAGGTSPGAK